MIAFVKSNNCWRLCFARIIRGHPRTPVKKRIVGVWRVFLDFLLARTGSHLRLRLSLFAVLAPRTNSLCSCRSSENPLPILQACVTLVLILQAKAPRSGSVFLFGHFFFLQLNKKKKRQNQRYNI